MAHLTLVQETYKIRGLAFGSPEGLILKGQVLLDSKEEEWEVVQRKRAGQ